MQLERSTATHPGTAHLRWRAPLALLAIVLAVGLVYNGRLALWMIGALPATSLPLAAAVAMLVVPGMALLRLLWPDTLAPAERWTLAIVVSSALPPLLLLLSEPFGLRWGPWLCWAYLVGSTLVLLWPGRARDSADGLQRRRPPSGESGDGAEGEAATERRAWLLSTWRPGRTNLLLIGITAAATGVRLYVARDLPVGMWGDSYQHTIMAQLLVDHGGLFSSWQPYAALKTFTYHYGFHSHVAWLSWLSGYPVTRGLLLVGQLQSAFAAPLAYLLTRRLLGSDRAALWAALIVAFVSPMPAYYLNWGRYTQLAGQTILPGAGVAWMALLDAAVEQPVRRARLARHMLLAVLLTAGLALTHYRVALFGACFVLVYAAYLLLMRARSLRAAARLGVAGLGATGLILAVVSPWLLRLRESALLRISGALLSTNVGADQLNSLPPSSEIFSLYAPGYLVALALVGAALLLWRRQWHGLVLVSWAAAVWVTANPHLVGLTGAGIITNFAVLIASYLVLAPLAAAAIAAAWAWMAAAPRAARLARQAQPLVGAVVVAWGLGQQQQIMAPANQLFTSADAAAMDWIRSQTPQDAKFFVNSFPAYGGTIYAGSDGGWWLPFMSDRQSNLPPLSHGTEVGEQPDYQLAVSALNAAIQKHPLGSPEAAAALRDAGFSYLYDGPAAAPPEEYIDPAALASSPLYELVYSRDGVTIWKVR